MRRTPPNGNEDDQIEDLPTTNIPRRRNLQTRYSSKQPAQDIQTPHDVQDAQEIENSSIDYYSDEQPRNPIRQRASLHLDQSAPPETSTAKTVRPPTTKKHSMQSSTTSMRTARPTPTGKISASRRNETEYPNQVDYRKSSAQRRQSGPREQSEYTETEYALDNLDYQDTDMDRDPRRTARIMVSPPSKGRHTAYTPQHKPPQARYRERGRHKPRTLLGTLQDISHNQTLLLVGSIVLVGLIVLPILVSAILNAAHPQGSGVITGVDGQNNGQSGQPGVNAPADPREIVIVPPVSDHPAPPLYATSAYLLDADTGATLYAHNPFLHLPMMSTTKLMTATLAIQQGNLDRRVTINDSMAKDLGTLSADSSLMGIKKGETYTLRDLLYGLLLVSGNDAAIAIADTVAGNLPNFVVQMNQKATQLGLHDTHYMNPHGLLATGHYSSAHDLAVLGRYSMSLPDLHKISGTKSYSITQSGDHAMHFLINGNQFLWWYPGVDGGKPGWDGGANFVQVISETRNGHHLIGVTMHTSDWWTDMRNLLNWGLNNFTWISPYDVDIAHPPIPFDYDWNYFAKDKRTNTIPTVDQGRYYIYSGYSINGPIMSYFDANGGLNKLGYPTGGLLTANGTIISQSFERGVVQCDTVSKKCKTI